MWVADRENGSCYCFYLSNKEDIKVLNFAVNKRWMNAILYYRGHFEHYNVPQEVMNIINEIENADLIIAPIADNNMYETLTSFAYNQISDEQCLHALSANNLGMQFVIKSERALKCLKMLDRLYLCDEEKTELLKKKKELGMVGRNKAELAINEYRRKGKYFDELFKKNG